MRIIIPEPIYKSVNDYITAMDTIQELGGMFFGRGNRIEAFLPCPNTSNEDRTSHYNQNSGMEIIHFGKYLGGLKVIADMHTHPEAGSLPSEADRKATEIQNGRLCSVIIAVKRENVPDRFSWFAHAKGNIPVDIQIINSEYNATVASIADQFGMIDLGRVLFSPERGIVCDTDLGKELLSVDTEKYKILKWIRSHTSYYCGGRVLSEVSRETGISLTKVKKLYPVLLAGVEKR